MSDIVAVAGTAPARQEGLQVVHARSNALSLLPRLPPGALYAVALGLIMRVVFSSLGAWALGLRPLRLTAVVADQYLGQRPLHDALLAPWQRFDALWYVRIAMGGYSAHDSSTVYLPVYPLLIRIVSVPLGFLIGAPLMLFMAGEFVRWSFVG